jgi:hypothetical protein
MSECVKLRDKLEKYTFRNSPPYPANKCKTMRKKGNDGQYYKSQPDKNGTYKWVLMQTKTNTKNKTMKKTKKTSVVELQKLAIKYKVTKSGTKKDIAMRIKKLRNRLLNKTDLKMIEPYL